VQLWQNQVAAISGPLNHIFVLKNAGFVSYGITGSYDVLAIVDQTHLPNSIKDRVTGAILGRSFEVRMTSAVRPCAPLGSKSFILLPNRILLYRLGLDYTLVDTFHTV